MDDDEVV